MLGYTSDDQLVLEANLVEFCQLKRISLNKHVDPKSEAIAFCVKTNPLGSFIKNRTNMHEMQNRFYTEYDAMYVSKLRVKMNQNMCVNFKLGYVDAKSDAIAFCVDISVRFVHQKSHEYASNAKSNKNRIQCKTTFTFHFACG